MSKYSSILAEAADAVVCNGFAEDSFGDVQEPAGYNALAVVSSTVLLNLGETELRDRYDSEFGDPRNNPSGYLVWIREDNNGFVDVVKCGSDYGTYSGSDAVNEAFVKEADRYYAQFADCTCGYDECAKHS